MNTSIKLVSSTGEGSTAQAWPLGGLTLEMGAMSGRITLTAESATLQLASSDASWVIANSRLQNLMTESLSAMSPIALMTGVVDGQSIGNSDSISRNSDLHREAMKLRLRAGAYTAFNNIQFVSIDSTARFIATGKQVNTILSLFGAARRPRILQLTQRIYL